MKPTKERFLGKGQFEKGGYEYEKQEQENKYLNSILKEADKEYDKIWSELGYKKSIPEFYHSQISKAYKAGQESEIVFGVSEWAEHGKKYGYWDYFQQQTIKQIEKWVEENASKDNLWNGTINKENLKKFLNNIY